jgi:hypothetical protein
MKRLICLFAVMFASSTIFAANPVPHWFMHISADNFGASGAGYSPGSNVWHCGWDILCPEGTPVKAVADGRIVASSPGGWDDRDRNENYGLLIEHQTSSGEKFIAIYGHLKRAWNTPAHRLLTDQEVRIYQVGLSVAEGEVIGKIGAYSTPHLHLAIYFDSGSPGAFPSSGYGRQPLPRPDAGQYKGVVSYGNWRSPRGWLATFTPHTSGFDDRLPTGASDNSLVYFIRKDINGEKLLSVGLDGGEVTTHMSFDADFKVDTLFAGEGQTVYVVSCRGNQYQLDHYAQAGRRKIYEQTYSFDLGRWRKEKEYIPILRGGLEWEILELNSGEVKPRNSVMSGGGDDWASIFFQQKEVWRLLGDSLNLQSGLFRPTTWVIDAASQTKRAVAGIPEGDCRGFIVFRTKYESDKGSERVAFGHLVAGSYRLIFARLLPGRDVTREGYRAEDLVSSKVFSLGLDVIPHSTVFDQKNEEFALVQVKKPEGWRIFRVNPWGVFKALTE